MLGFPPTTRVTVLDPTAAATAQLQDRFDCVVLGTHTVLHGADRRALLHTAVQHLERRGRLMVLHPEGLTPWLPEATALDLAMTLQVPVGELTASVFRRGDRVTVHDLVFQARAQLQRMSPAALQAAIASPKPPLVIDTRTPSDRERFGTIEGSQHLPRTVVEWRLDPANGYLHPAVTGFEQQLVVVCNHGYSSSLAAANLQAIGYLHATDLIGGIRAWQQTGLALVPPDHTFLEL
jgi:rhodanese-related sulfurtransferase